jgi:hypothetical protein
MNNDVYVNDMLGQRWCEECWVVALENVTKFQMAQN